jgi:hypothetical protein
MNTIVDVIATIGLGVGLILHLPPRWLIGLAKLIWFEGPDWVRILRNARVGIDQADERFICRLARLDIRWSIREWLHRA